MDVILALILWTATMLAFRLAKRAMNEPTTARFMNYWLVADIVTVGITTMFAMAMGFGGKAIADLWIHPDVLSVAVLGLAALGLLTKTAVSLRRRRRTAAPTSL